MLTPSIIPATISQTYGIRNRGVVSSEVADAPKQHRPRPLGRELGALEHPLPSRPLQSPWPASRPLSSWFGSTLRPSHGLRLGPKGCSPSPSTSTFFFLLRHPETRPATAKTPGPSEKAPPQGHGTHLTKGLSSPLSHGHLPADSSPDHPSHLTGAHPNVSLQPCSSSAAGPCSFATAISFFPPGPVVAAAPANASPTSSRLLRRCRDPATLLLPHGPMVAAAPANSPGASISLLPPQPLVASPSTDPSTAVSRRYPRRCCTGTPATTISLLPARVASRLLA